MKLLWTILVVIGTLGLIGLALSLRIVKQYERGVLFRLGRVRLRQDLLRPGPVGLARRCGQPG